MFRFILMLPVLTFLPVGCARPAEEPAIPDVVLVPGEGEVLGFESNAELDASAVGTELLTEESLSDHPQNCCGTFTELARFDEALVRATSTPFWLFSDSPEPTNPDTRWFVHPERENGSESSLLCCVGTMSSTGSTGAVGYIAPSYPGRTGATKVRLLREGGGNEDSERAVALGLAWIARQQKEDGGWEFDAGEQKDRIAATGLALLPYLGAGETHLKGKMYRKTVAEGLKFLLRNCPLNGANSGRMSTNTLSQALATLALCEAYGLTKDKGLLLGAAQAAVNHIVKTQRPNGSWGYMPGINGDLSIVGWQIQALKAAQTSKDIMVQAFTLKKAIEFLNLTGAGPLKSMYGYDDAVGTKRDSALTATGLLFRYYLDGWGPDNQGMIDGISGLMERAPLKSPASPDINFLYHASQVVKFSEGVPWKDWNEGPKGPDAIRKGGMRDWLVSLQNRKDGPNQGSFDPDLYWVGRSCGRLGTTAMSVLTLEVYYRQLPLYKPANEGDPPINK